MRLFDCTDVGADADKGCLELDRSTILTSEATGLNAFPSHLRAARPPGTLLISIQRPRERRSHPIQALLHIPPTILLPRFTRKARPDHRLYHRLNGLRMRFLMLLKRSLGRRRPQVLSSAYHRQSMTAY